MAPLNNAADPMNDIWLPRAMSEPLILHALLFRDASTLDVAKGCSESAATTTHRLATIRVINERLGRPGEPDDMTIAAITTLAAEEVRIHPANQIWQ